ncbi:serine protease FAM111A-like isoform X3 [Montipora capricornis]|uniref:serine protease FAM111A-like isoform X3 n=1 Tax=Montipora capricornis TaxID=246305 RepID=UPI0035F1E42F
MNDSGCVADESLQEDNKSLRKMNDSGCVADESLQEDNKSLSEPEVKNPLNETEGSLTIKDAVEKKENFRTAGDPKLYCIRFPDFKKLQGKQKCESSGNETILDMVKRKFQKVGFKSCKPKFENIIFFDENDNCLNVGLPAGVLSTAKTYKCVFKKELVFRPSDFRRDYAVEEYDENWKFESFLVSFTEVNRVISRFSKIVHSKMQVDFFNGETIFEALSRDNRFVEKMLRRCLFTCADEDGGLMDLSMRAHHFQGKSIEIRVVQEEDKDLPQLVHPRKRPKQDPVAANGKVEDKPSKTTQQPDSASGGPSTETSSASFPSLMRNEFTEDLTHLIECAFDIKSQKLTSRDKKKLVQRCNQILRQCNFASAENMSIFVSDVEELAEIAKSVGVVIKIEDGGSSFLAGTCFRIGTQFIITNKHVYDKLSEIRPGTVFIDFAFKKGEAPSPHGQRYQVLNVLVSSSEELDYAILKLREPPHELPPSIFTTGVTIMDPSKNPHHMLQGQKLRLIGHPNKQRKKIDPICPVFTIPQDGRAYHRYSLRMETFLALTDQRRETYHVSNFFFGSSGSPGILFENDKKYLVVLHTKGFFLEDHNRSSIEQGVLFTEIVKDVKQSIENADHDPSIRLADIFPRVESWPELMDTD